MDSLKVRAALVRVAIAAAVLVVPLLGAGVAQAAMGGALPLTSTFRPDLKSVAIDISSDTAQFCFDKTLSQTLALNPSNFMLGGYASYDNTSTDPNTRPTPVNGG